MSPNIYSDESRERALKLLRSKGVSSVSRVLKGFDENAVEAARRVGLEEMLNTATYVQVNEAVIKTLMEERLRRMGVIVSQTSTALEDNPWAREYYWKAIQVDKDVYTALIEVYGEGKGYLSTFLGD